jgi:hypothetical protein
MRYHFMLTSMEQLYWRSQFLIFNFKVTNCDLKEDDVNMLVKKNMKG